MFQIRPVSDLRNTFPEIESVANSAQPVYLTKNGYVAMVVMSLEQYSLLTENTEAKLDEADRLAATSEKRLSHDEVFGDVRRRLNEKL